MTTHPARRAPGGATTPRPREVGPWRTSSYSGNGMNCVEVAPWRTASYSGNGQNCVEVAPAESGVLVRDTKDRGAGPVLTFTAAEWAAFLAATRSGTSEPGAAFAVVPTEVGVDVRPAADGPTLHFTPSEWSAFRSGVHDGEFDTLVPA